MKGIISAAIICSLCVAVCMGYPSTVSTQWHFRAPAFGCVEVSHSKGGNQFRVYMCDHTTGSCIFPNNVDACPLTPQVFNAKPLLERVVNIRNRDHFIRFYEAGFAEVEEECKSVTLPNGETLYDPIGCGSKPGGKVQADDSDEKCRSVTLPTGETLYDPIDCNLNKPKGRTQEFSDNIAALLELLKDN